MITDALSVLRAEVQIDPTSTPNLMPNPSGDGGAWFWVTPLRFTQVTSVGGALRLSTATGVGDAYTQTNPIRVAAGDYIGARFDTVGGTAGHEVKLRWRWFNLAGELLSESTQTSAFNTTAGTHYKSAVVAPAGTSFAKLKIDLYNAGSPPAANAHYDFQNVMVTTDAATFANTYSFTEPVEYTNILGPTNNITINRAAMDTGTVAVRVLDTSLDPAAADNLRTGRLFRVTALNDDTATFEDLVAGLYIIRAEVAYDFTKPPEKQAVISLTLTDSLQLLANSIRKVSVGTMEELPFVVETVGIPFNVNGETGTLLDDITVTARIDGATGLDQVLLTRDSNQGYTWISKEGVLNAWNDRTTDFYGGAVTFDESSYSNIDIGFDTDKCINEVLVVRVVENPFTGETVEKTYGPFRDEAAVDEWKVVRQATFRVTGIAEVDVPAFAAAALADRSVPVRRVNSITVPIRTAADITTAKALIDLYATANIINTSKGIDLDQHVTSISHNIQASENSVRWLMTLGFDVLESVSGPAPTSGASGAASVKPASSAFYPLDDRTLDPTYGDHFNDVELDSKWTRRGSFVSGDETYQTGGGSYLTTAERVPPSWYSQAAPAGNFTIMAKVLLNGSKNGRMFGLMMTDNSGAGVGGGFYNGSPNAAITAQLNTSTTYDGAHFQSIVNPFGSTIDQGFPCWYRLTKVGNTFKTSLSLNGHFWLPDTPLLTPTGLTLVPTRIGFGNFFGATLVPAGVNIDWFDVV